MSFSTALGLALMFLGPATGPGLPRNPPVVFASTPREQQTDIAALERAVAVKPDDVNAQRKLAQAYDASGKRMEAVAVWRKVTELAPKLPGAWYRSGMRIARSRRTRFAASTSGPKTRHGASSSSLTAS